MTRLIGFEWKKMMKRPFTLFVMAACLVLTVVMVVTTAMSKTINVWGPDYYGSYEAIPAGLLKKAHELGFTGRYDGLVELKGLEAINLYRQYEERFEGPWDQERLAQIVAEYRAIEQDPASYTDEINEIVMRSRRMSFLSQGMTEEEIDAFDAANPIYVKTGRAHGEFDKFGSLYTLLEYYILNEDGSALLFDEAFPYVKEPAEYRSALGPAAMANNQEHTIGLLIALAVLAIAAPLFSDEATSGTEEMLLATRYGRTRLVRAKLAAGFGAAIGCVVITAAVNLALSCLLYGPGGLTAPIQFSYGNISVPFSLVYWQFILVICGLQILGSLAFAGLLMLLSAHARTAFPVVFIGAVFFFFDMMLTNNIDAPYRHIAQELPAGLVMPHTLLIEARVPVLGALPNWVMGIAVCLTLTLAAAAWIIARYRKKMVR